MKTFKNIRKEKPVSKGQAVVSDKIGDLKMKIVKKDKTFDVIINDIKFDSFASKEEATKIYKELMSVYSKDNK